MKKIMFNDKFLLTKAVLEGRKTQTRRIITPQPIYKDNCSICWKGYAYGLKLINEPFGSYDNFISGTEYDKSCRRYRTGDIVAVAQSYETSWLDNASAYHNPYFLKGLPGWKNKLFVASNHMPHQIRITDVRVERLQDILDEDCLKEGIEDMGPGGSLRYSFTENVRQTTGDIIAFLNNFATVREAFAHLINKVSRKDVWSENPYIFVYDFELVK